MKTHLKVTLISVTLLFLGSAVYPQVPSATECTLARVDVRPLPSRMVPVTGAPYSGDEEPYNPGLPPNVISTLPSNFRTQIAHIYRDSDGRVRREQSVCIFGLSEGPKTIEIRDPVSGVQYVLETQKHLAHRSLLTTVSPNAPLANAPHAQAVSNAAPQITKESLGTQTIEGLAANGTKVTSTYPADPRNGLVRVLVCENWIAPELQITVISKCSDSSGLMGEGESGFHFTHISRDEPDPALFWVPPDFTIVDDSGPI